MQFTFSFAESPSPLAQGLIGIDLRGAQTQSHQSQSSEVMMLLPTMVLVIDAVRRLLRGLAAKQSVQGIGSSFTIGFEITRASAVLVTCSNTRLGTVTRAELHDSLVRDVSAFLEMHDKLPNDHAAVADLREALAELEGTCEAR